MIIRADTLFRMLLACTLGLTAVHVQAQFGNNTANGSRAETMSNAERRAGLERCDTLAPGSQARDRCMDDLVLNRNAAQRNAADPARVGDGARSNAPRDAAPAGAARDPHGGRALP